MIDPGSTAYIWIKTLHVITVITWMAGIFYLPRLFVYHADAKPGGEAAETFKIMERRLLHVIMTPSMIIALATGALMFPAWMSAGWMHVKLLMVAVILGAHIYFARVRVDFDQGRNRRSARFFRIANEVPTVAFLILIIMVVAKPF